MSAKGAYRIVYNFILYITVYILLYITSYTVYIIVYSAIKRSNQFYSCEIFIFSKLITPKKRNRLF